MDVEFDKASYDEGKASFAAGATVFDIVEQVRTAQPEDRNKIISGVVGFVDGLLEHIRFRPILVVEHVDGTVTPLQQCSLIDGPIRHSRHDDRFRS